MAHGRGEAPRMEIKRKLDEEPRNWGRGNTGVPKILGPAPSSSRHVRHVPTGTTQPLDTVNCSGSLETFKRARMEAATKGQPFPIHTNGDDHFNWGYDETAENTRPLHREYDIPFNHGGGSKSPKEIDVPNIQASAGGATAGGVTAGGVVGFGFKLQLDDKGIMSLNMTEEFVQGVFQGLETNIVMKVESKGSGANGKCLPLWTCEVIKDDV